MHGENSIESNVKSSGTKTEEAQREPEVASTDYDEVVVRDEKYTEMSSRTVVAEDSVVQNCPSGFYYNASNRKCECQTGYVLDPDTNDCRSKFSSTTTTTMKPSPTFFYPEARKLCPMNDKWDPVIGDCRDIDECTEGPGCQNDEICHNRSGGYDCIPICSSDGWQFDPLTKTCQDIDECLLDVHDCPRTTHRCVNTNGTFVCEKITDCPKGHRRIYNGSCVDVDECVEGPGCREFELCKNLKGNYDCLPLCSSGWHFDPLTKGCLDVDECLLGLHDCSQTTHRCVNLNGTYTCQLVPPCTTGFRKLFNGSCVDIDECVENLHDCPIAYHRYCVNREGTYECVTRYPECPKGFEYSLRSRNCEDIDECARGDFKCDAKFGERCKNLPGSYRCERPASSGQGFRQRPACPSGYRYDTGRRQCSGENKKK